MRTYARAASSLVIAISCIGASLLTGCGMGTVNSTISPLKTNTLVSGNVHGGTQGISGSTVQLWQTGTTGYGAGATLLATTYSSVGNGSFSFPNPVTITSDCSTTAPQGPYTYVTAAGGDPSSSFPASATVKPTRDNKGILLVGMIGCGAVNSTTTVVIDEVTTVAAGYALGNFSAVTSVSEANGDTLPQLNIGAPTTNYQGLADAVANAALLANVNTGQATTSTSTLEVPTAAVNTVADLIASCANSATAPYAPCPTIFGYATPPNGATPGNVYQVVENIAKYPGNNVTNLLSSSTAYAPYQPTMAGGASANGTTSVLNDLSLGVAYLNTSLATTAGSSPVGLTIDSFDNVWVTGGSTGTTTSTYNYISELSSSNNGGTYNNTLASSATLDGTHTLRSAAFDTSGNLWITDKNATAGGIIELPKSGNVVNTGSPTEYTFGNTTLEPNDYDLAVDASNNIWTASYGASGSCTAATSGTVCDYVEFPVSTSYAATITFGGTVGINTPSVRGMTADAGTNSPGLGNIWTANYGVIGATTAGKTVEVLNPTSGKINTYTLGSTADSPFGVATDALGNAFVTTTATQATSALYEIPQGTPNSGVSTISSSVATTGNVPTSGAATLANIPNANSSSPASTATTPLAIGGLNGPGYDVIDGAGNVFIANYQYGTIVEYAPALNGYVSPFYGFSPNVVTPTTTIPVTFITLGSTGTANIYYTTPTDVAVVGQQVTFSGLSGAYAFLNGNTYTISNTSFNYFVIPDGGQTSASKTAVTGSMVLAGANQVLFQCGPYATTTTATTCGTVGNAQGHNNSIAVDRAGTVWTLSTTGTVVGMIGTAAPTNPVLAAGAVGVLP
jgi:hypothetical protein